MKPYLSFPVLFAFFGLTCLSISADVSIDFTKAQDYEKGVLSQHEDWTSFDASKSDPDTFTVEPAGSGVLRIDPTSTGFQVADFVGKGSELSKNCYTGEMSLLLKYTPGTNATVSYGVPVLPQIQFGNVEAGREGLSFGIRQVMGTNTFNIIVASTLNGDVEAAFGKGFTGEAIGLSVDAEEKWTDGESDMLSLTFALKNEGENQWVVSSTLTNTSTSEVITQVEKTFTDTDGSFGENNQRVRIIPANMNTQDVAVLLDKIEVSENP